MTISTDFGTIVWNGSHYGNVFTHDGKEVDAFSFAWEKDKPTELDFTEAAQQYLIDMAE